MSESLNAITLYFAKDLEVERGLDLRDGLDLIFGDRDFQSFLSQLIIAPAFTPEYGRAFATAGALPALAPCRMLRGALNLTLAHFFGLLAQIAPTFSRKPETWSAVSERVHAAPMLADIRVAAYLTVNLPEGEAKRFFVELIDRAIEEYPHAIYPTSNYRESDGFVESTPDHRNVEAVMSFRTFASIRMVDHMLDPAQTELRDIYRPLGRCVCLIDLNVHALYGNELTAYFDTHHIALEMLVYRATEADKGLKTVERMLGDFKRLGISRNEPVLLVGGGVLADTGGLACALYGRNTPYTMLATSIVSGIDAGPSPRTCCDGFGYKNLLGAYHPPTAFFVDRFFFRTLHEGWLRHGIAEIIKIAVVKNAELFADLEAAQDRLITTRFGTVQSEGNGDIERLSQAIIGGAMRSYIESEYGNLYETHQCRPHAYGHTWSPGFEIEAGLLHGHAVAIDMGFGAYLSLFYGWIEHSTFDRIMTIMSNYGLSLWHDILEDERIMWESHRKIIQKRGGNLVAPLPKGDIGRCGYLNDLTRPAFFSALSEYHSICSTYPRNGRGIDPLCSDVGLDDPAATSSVEKPTEIWRKSSSGDRNFA